MLRPPELSRLAAAAAVPAARARSASAARIRGPIRREAAAARGSLPPGAAAPAGQKGGVSRRPLPVSDGARTVGRALGASGTPKAAYTSASSLGSSAPHPAAGGCHGMTGPRSWLKYHRRCCSRATATSSRSACASTAMRTGRGTSPAARAADLVRKPLRGGAAARWRHPNGRAAAVALAGRRIVAPPPAAGQ